MARTSNRHHEPLIRISKRDGMVWWKSWLVRGAAIVLALLVCAVLIVCITGVNPLEFYASMLKGSFGSIRKLWLTAQNTAMLLCIALAVTPAFKMKFWNTGAEGQVLIGALASAACMIWWGNSMPGWLLLPVMALVCRAAGVVWSVIPVVALETAAANLGSALTPVGNPQNLYLYSAYGLTPGEFFSVTVPLCAVSLALCGIAALCVREKGRVTVQADAPAPLDGKRLALHGALLALCIAAVFSLVDWRVSLAVVSLCLLLFDRAIFRRVDYALLATFACFFLFSGNLASLPPVRALLTSLMEKSAFFASLLASQVISNVPAALLLSPFTDDARAMLLGTDVGGLGTLVASLASLISYKYYARSKGADSGRYLLWFTALNLLLLVPLIALSLLLLA